MHWESHLSPSNQPPRQQMLSISYRPCRSSMHIKTIFCYLNCTWCSVFLLFCLFKHNMKILLYHTLKLSHHTLWYFTEWMGHNYSLSCMWKCWEPAWGIPPVTRSCGRTLMARLIRTQVFPLEFPEHPPPQKNIRTCLLFHSSDILWKKSIQGFTLLHLKECFNPKTPLMAF